MIFHRFKNLSRDIKVIFKKDEIKLLKIKSTMCEMKNTSNVINSWLDAEQVSEFEAIAIEAT